MTISKARALFLPYRLINAESGAKESQAFAYEDLTTSTYKLMMLLVVLREFVLLKSVRSYLYFHYKCLTHR